jgi:Leucine-rich repeat (LRR) protein
VKAMVPSEVVLISKKALEEILLSSNLELHKIIQEMSLELAKKSDLNLPISHQKLLKLVEKSPTVIKALSLQLHHRLSERIY